MSAPKPATERRHNHSLRHQAQAWFDVLRRHIDEVDGAEAVAPLFKSWAKPEDIMLANPEMVPAFLGFVWSARKSDWFADLFRTASGEVAEEPTEILALSQKSFDSIVLAHLMGTMRLTCEHRQNKWLAVEREKRRSDLSKMPVVGTTLRALGFLPPVKTEILLADYPRRNLYDLLKPFLRRREQFALVEALAALPTRTASVLGPIVGGLSSTTAIHALALLKKAPLKIAIEMAETFVQAVTAPQAEGAEAVDPAGPVGAALSDMLNAGPHFALMAADNKQLARDAITKFAPVMRAEIWTIFRDAGTMRRIAECPVAIAENLQALTAEISERVSIALSGIEDSRVAAYAMKTLREDVDPKIFLYWLRDETYVTAWKQLVQNLNRAAITPHPSEKLGPQHKASIKTVCNRGARVFAEIANPQKKAA